MGITSIVTGMIFTLIVTRRLTPEEFGTWNLIGGLITYVMIIEPTISYWAVRHTARGVKVAKTALICSGIISSGATLAYLLIAYFVGQQSNVVKDVLLFAAILVPVMFLKQTLTAINLGHRPQSTSYGLIAFELIKIPTAVSFVYYLDMGIIGAIFSTFIAYIGNIIILIFYSRDQLIAKFEKGIVKNWLSRSWLPIYPGVSSVIFHLDVILFSVITKSVVGIAYYSAAITISALVTNAGLISQALYPKLIGGGKKEHLQENLTRFFYFGVPLTALSIVFAKPTLFALNPQYMIAVPVVIFMTVRTFLYVLGGIFTSAIQGIETVDLNEESRFKDFIKSKLFFLPTIQLIQYGSYALVLAITLFSLSRTSSQLELAIYWSVITLITQIPFTIYYYYLTRKSFTLSVDKGSLLRYLLASVVTFGGTYVLVEKFLQYKNNIYQFLPNLLLFVSIAIGGYLLLTYLTDHRTRLLFKSILNEIKK